MRKKDGGLILRLSLSKKVQFQRGVIRKQRGTVVRRPSEYFLFHRRIILGFFSYQFDNKH